MKILIAGLASIATIVGVSAAAYAFSPDRPTYTVEHPANQVVLNSITNNPREGDERSFFSVADSATPATTAHDATVHDGEIITLRLYVNNNANPSLNGTKLDGNGVAKNTRVRVALPTTTASSQQISAYASADNAQPKSVSDTVVATGSQPFSLSYNAGSASLSNTSVGSDGLKLSDDIVKSGAQIGYSQTNGILPAWFQYAGVITLNATVHMSGAPTTTKTTSFTVAQTVALTSDTKWSKSITASAGQKVKYSVGFTNTGTEALSNVVLNSELPSGVSIVKGSAKLFNSTNKNGKSVSDDIVTSKGVNIGSYGATANGYVTFTATLPASDKLACGDNTLTNTGHATAAGIAMADTTVVKITKTCATPAAPTTPVTPAPTTPQNLSNTGPGNTIALFAVASVVGAGAYHFYIKRRLVKG